MPIEQGKGEMAIGSDTDGAAQFRRIVQAHGDPIVRADGLWFGLYCLSGRFGVDAGTGKCVDQTRQGVLQHGKPAIQRDYLVGEILALAGCGV
jgi:hypothetical protein